jgi:hypothetical protein
MPVEYKSIVPWGRSFEEYVRMFRLDQTDLSKKILSCGDGPASFNWMLTKKGGVVISVDPIYQFSRVEIKSKIDETFQIVLEQTRHNVEKFVWHEIKNIEALGQIRLAAMNNFLADYEEGKRHGRYIFGELPMLPAINTTFDLALSSHFLFLYSDNLTYEFHEASIAAMLDIANEVRIFPLLDNNANRSKYVDKIIAKYKKRAFLVEEVLVNYEFQKNGNKMLRICHQ